MDKHKQGKRNRAAGKRFELKVREDLEKNDWIVFRNSNDVEFEELPDDDGIPFTQGEFKQAKSKWNPFLKRAMMTQSGFPDFLILSEKTCWNCIAHHFGPCGYEVQFVECKGGNKTNKYLSKEEKAKVEWIKKHLKIPVLVANKGDKRGEITYD
jgi:hypothetical protein